MHKFPKLDLYTLKIHGYFDDSFSSNEKLSSQLGNITQLLDASCRTIHSEFNYQKARKVTWKVLATELIAFKDMFYVYFTIFSKLEYIIGRYITMNLLTDKKCLFDII